MVDSSQNATVFITEKWQNNPQESDERDGFRQTSYLGKICGMIINIS